LRWEPELTQIGAPLPNCQEEAPLSIEKLNIVEQTINDVDDAVGVHCDTLRHRQVTRSIAVMAE
jgi:hypothetical protein